MAREEMICDQIDEDRCDAAHRRWKSHYARLDVGLHRTERIDAAVEPDTDLDQRRQFGRYRAFDEITEEAADEVVRMSADLSATKRAVGEKIHMSPIDGGTR